VSRGKTLAEPTGKRTSNKFCGKKGAGSEGMSVGTLMKVLKLKIRI